MKCFSSFLCWSVMRLYIWFRLVKGISFISAVCQECNLLASKFYFILIFFLFCGGPTAELRTVRVVLCSRLLRHLRLMCALCLVLRVCLCVCAHTDRLSLVLNGWNSLRFAAPWCAPRGMMHQQVQYTR